MSGKNNTKNDKKIMFCKSFTKLSNEKSQAIASLYSANV
jgi:hypothetical protein